MREGSQFGLVLKDQRGSVLLATLFGVLIITLTGVALIEGQAIDQRLVVFDRGQSQAFYSAAYGINRALLDWDQGTCGIQSFATANGATGTPITLAANAALCPQWNKFSTAYTYTVAAKQSAANTAWVTVISTSCPPGGSGTSCVSVQADVVNATFAKIPFFAENSLTISGGSTGSPSIVDSFDSAAGGYSSTKCQSFGCIGTAQMLWTNGTPATRVTDVQDTFASGTTIYGNITAAKGEINFNGGTAKVYGSVTYDNVDGSLSCANPPGCSPPTGIVQSPGTITGTTVNPISVPTVQGCTSSTYSSFAAVSSVLSGVLSSEYNAATGVLDAHGVVTVNPGQICLGNMTFHTTVQVPSTVTAAAIVKTTGWISMQGTLVNSSLKSPYLQFLSTYSGSTTITVPAGASSTSYIYLYAPAAQVVVSGSADFYGAIVAKTLTSSGGASLHFDKALGRASADLGAGIGSAYVLQSWKRCHGTCA